MPQRAWGHRVHRRCDKPVALRVIPSSSGSTCIMMCACYYRHTPFEHIRDAAQACRFIVVWVSVHGCRLRSLVAVLQHAWQHASKGYRQQKRNAKVKTMFSVFLLTLTSNSLAKINLRNIPSFSIECHLLLPSTPQHSESWSHHCEGASWTSW